MVFSILTSEDHGLQLSNIWRLMFAIMIALINTGTTVWEITAAGAAGPHHKGTSIMQMQQAVR